MKHKSNPSAGGRGPADDPFLSRRRFLRSAGAAGLAMPLLDHVRAPRSAQAAGGPKRLIVFYTPNGIIHDTWAPTGTETAFTYGPILAPLEKHKKDIIVIDGLNNLCAYKGDQHGAGIGTLLTATEVASGNMFGFPNRGTLTGWGNAQSVDQVVAERIGAGRRFTSIDFCLKRTPGTLYTRLSYRAPQIPIAPESDPAQAFDRLFAGLDVNVDPTLAARARGRRKSVLDKVMAEFEAMRPRLAEPDRLKFEAHLDGLRSLERQVANSAAGPIVGCMKPTRTTLGSLAEVKVNQMGFESVNAAEDKDAPERFKAFQDMIVASFACDTTRVATMMMGPARGELVLSWLGINRGHHTISHSRSIEANQQLTDIMAWYAARLGDLVSALKAVPEGGGTLFDNTLILWCNELGNGASHLHRRIPFALIGSAGGYFRTGRYLKVSGAHNDLLLSVCHGMGLTDLKTFGNPKYATGPLAGLT